MLVFWTMLDTSQDRDKFVRLYEKYKHFMWYIANGVLKDDYLAEDAVHEAFLTIVHHLNNIDEAEEGKTRSFFAAIVRCRAIDILRKKNKAEIIPIEAAEEQLSDDEELLEEYISEENYQSILKCISMLDEKYRLVFELRYLHELTDKEIAGILEISPKTANVRIYRARKKLQELLKREVEICGTPKGSF